MKSGWLVTSGGLRKAHVSLTAHTAAALTGNRSVQLLSNKGCHQTRLPANRHRSHQQLSSDATKTHSQGLLLAVRTPAQDMQFVLLLAQAAYMHAHADGPATDRQSAATQGIGLQLDRRGRLLTHAHTYEEGYTTKSLLFERHSCIDMGCGQQPTPLSRHVEPASSI
jgi:hypothetical protein